MIVKKEKSPKTWRFPVILTEKGIAFTIPEIIPIQNYCGINVDNLYYVPWHAVYKPKKFASRLAIGNYHFFIKKDKKLESIKPFKIRVKELKERSSILMEKSKDKIYEGLVPILKSYPKRKIPSSNPSNISMIGMVYTELKSKYLQQCTREIREGIFRDREIIPPVPRDAYYGRERIIEEVRSYEFEQGTYDEVMKVEELKIVFANFFGKHSLEETVDLIMELIETNANFFIKWYKTALLMIKNKFPTREKEIFELEKFVSLNTAFKLIFYSDEYIVADFKGIFELPKSHFEFPGHIYITNYRCIFPNIPKTKTFYSGGLLTGAIAAGRKSHIIKAREEFFKILAQNPDMFFIQNPYNIRFNYGRINFTMNYNYEDKMSSISKIYKLDISIKIDGYKKEKQSSFTQRTKEIFSKVQDLFSLIPNTVCPKCNNVQDKSLEKCAKCGKSLKINF